jgi:hypothetical protein
VKPVLTGLLIAIATAAGVLTLHAQFFAPPIALNKKTVTGVCSNASGLKFNKTCDMIYVPALIH